MVKKISTRAVKKIKKEGEELRQEVRKRTVIYVTAALGLVVGLAWNEAIKSIIEYFFPLSQNTVAAKIIYALAMTAVLAVATVYILKEPNNEKK